MKKIDPDFLETVKEIMRMSIDFETACRSLDIGQETIDAWSDLQEVKKAISEAEAQFEVMLIKKIWEEGGIKGIEILLKRFDNQKCVAISGGGGDFKGFE